MKRILFVIPTLTGGGAERAMSNLTTHLPDDVDADILLNSVSETDYPTDANIIDLGMKPRRDMPLYYQAIAFCKRLRTLRVLKKTGGYDACISFMDSANIANILSRHSNKHCKTIVSIRCAISEDSTFAYRCIVGPLIRALYNYADRVTCLSAGVQQDLIERYGILPDKTCVVYNGFDVQAIQNQAGMECTAELPDGFRFIHSGRLAFQKAQWHLIRAFSLVHSKHPDCKLVILGDGADRAYLDNLVESLSLQDAVTFLGFVSNPFSVMRNCQAFVFPSMFEGFGNALAEALICGMPCIASDCNAGPREILAPDASAAIRVTDTIEYAEYGILTPVCSGTRHTGDEPLEPAELLLAESMCKLYEDAELRGHYEKQAVARGEQLGIAACVKQWMVLIN